MDVSGFLLRQRQRLMFPEPRHGRLKRYLARLIAAANSCARTASWGQDFYRLKDRLLKRYARRVGDDWQVIERTCYGCYNCGDWQDRGWGCDGTGVFSRTCWRLERYELGGRVFHRPAERAAQLPIGIKPIKGRISHAPVEYETAKRAWELLRAASLIVDGWADKEPTLIPF